MKESCLGYNGMVEIIAPEQNMDTIGKMYHVDALAHSQFPFPVMEEKKFTNGDLEGYYIYFPPYTKENGCTYASKYIVCDKWEDYLEETEKIFRKILDKGLIYCRVDRKLHTKEEIKRRKEQLEEEDKICMESSNCEECPLHCYDTGRCTCGRVDPWGIGRKRCGSEYNIESLVKFIF